MKKPRRIAFSWLILWVAFAHLLFLSPTTALPSAECNICGCADCTMGNPRGLVTYTYGDGSVTSECQALQLQVYGDPLWGCGNAELWERAVEPCVCQNAEGVLLASNTESHLNRKRELQDIATDDDESSLLFGKQWTLPYGDSSTHASFVSSMAFDATHNLVYMIGTVAPNACWVATLNLETQQLHQQVLDSQGTSAVQSCQNLILYDSNRVFAIGHANRGGGFLSDLEQDQGGIEAASEIYGMVLDLQRVELPPSVEQQQSQQRSNIFARHLVGNTFGSVDDVANTTAEGGNVTNATEVEDDILFTNGNSTSDSNETLTTDEVESNSTDYESNSTGTNLTAGDDSNATDPWEEELGDSNSTDVDEDDSNFTVATPVPEEEDSNSTQSNSTSNSTLAPEPDEDTNGNEFGDFNSTDLADDDIDDGLANNETDTNSTELDCNSTAGCGNLNDTNSTDDGHSNRTDSDSTDSNETEGDSVSSNNTDTDSTDLDNDEGGSGNSNYTVTNSTGVDCNSTVDCEGSNNTDDSNSTDIDDSNSTDYGDTNSTDLDSNQTAPSGDSNFTHDTNSTDLGNSNSTVYGDSNDADSNSTHFDRNSTNSGDSNNTDNTNSTEPDCDGALCGDFNYTDTNSTDMDDTNSTKPDCDGVVCGDSNFTDANSTDLDVSNSTEPEPDCDGALCGDFNYTDTNSTDLDDTNSTESEPDCEGALCGDFNYTDTNSTDPDDTNSTEPDCDGALCGDFNYTDTNSTDLDDTNSTEPDCDGALCGDSNYTNTNSTEPDDTNSTEPDCDGVFCGDFNHTDTNSTDLDDTNSTDSDSNTTDTPTFSPTLLASDSPTVEPKTGSPTFIPTLMSSDSPSGVPTIESPTFLPTPLTSDAPTQAPTGSDPTSTPTFAPTPLASNYTDTPTWSPSDANTTVIENNGTDYGDLTPAPMPEEEDPQDDANSTDAVGNGSQDLIGEDDFSLELKGGRILGGADYVFPMHSTSDRDFFYVVSLESFGTVHRDGTAPLGLFHADRNYNNRSRLKISALPMISSSSPTDVKIRNTLAVPVWERIVDVNGTGAILGIGGIIQMGNAIFVGGSTNREGAGLGASSSPGDVDGFVTKLSKDSGRLFGTDGEPDDTNLSYRVQSPSEANNFVRGLCASPSGEAFLYVAGSSIDAAKGNASRAFLTKVRAADLVVVWSVDLRAEDLSSTESSPVLGISCAVTEDEDSVFFVGNVENDGVVVGSNSTESAGGTDVFVAKVDGKTGSVVFVTQIGSAGDDFVAPGGSISLKADGTAIVVGTSDGNLYRSRNITSSTYFEAFVALVAADGSIPMTSPPMPTSPPTVAPTVDLTEDPQNSTMGPTASPTLDTSKFTFNGITLRLEGSGPLTKESRRAFESTMVGFYRDFYKRNGDRRLQVAEVDQFDTTVAAAGEEPDALGNIIEYDQTVFLTSSDNRNFSIDEAKSLVTAPFQTAEVKRLLVTSLRASDDNFQRVSSIGDPVFATSDNPATEPPARDSEVESDSGVNIFLYFFIASGVFGCCLIGGLGFFFYYLRRKRKEREAKADAGPILAPTLDLDVVHRQSRRLSRAKNVGDYSAAYLTNLEDIENFGGRSESFDYKAYNASSDFSRSFHASQDFSLDGSQERIRVNLPVRKGRSRNTSRESFRGKGYGADAWDDAFDGNGPDYSGYGEYGPDEDYTDDRDYTEGQEYDDPNEDYAEGQDNSDGPEYAEGDEQYDSEDCSGNADSHNRSYGDACSDEEMQIQQIIETPKKSGIISDCFDTPEPPEQHSDSYNSFFEQFGDEPEEFPEPVPDLGMGIDSERGSSYRSERDEEALSYSEESEALGSYLSRSESSDSEPHIKVSEQNEDMSSFTGGDSTQDFWPRGF